MGSISSAVAAVIGLACLVGCQPAEPEVAAPKGLRLLGRRQGSPARKFEILMDGSHYSLRLWQQGRWGADVRNDTVEIVLPHWSGNANLLGAGGKSYGDFRRVWAPGRGLWDSGRLVGAEPDATTFQPSERLRVDYGDLESHGGILIPGRIRIRQYDWQVVNGQFVLTQSGSDLYRVEQVELLAKSPAAEILALKDKVWGDTRSAVSRYKDGSKYSETIYNRRLPVLDLEWHENGQLLRLKTHDQGIPEDEIEWHANGQKKKVTHYRDGNYTFTSWYPDGTVSFEGRWDEASKHYQLVSYWPNGKRQEVRNMLAGRRHGVYQNWDQQGRVINDGVYRHGEPWSGIFREIPTDGHYIPSATMGNRDVTWFANGKELDSPPSQTQVKRSIQAR